MTEKAPRDDDSCCAPLAKRPDAGTLGVLSAVFASTCCGLPLLLLMLGMGGLGLGSILGTYHWYLTAAGVASLTGAWFVFLRETAAARSAGSRVCHSRLLPAVLVVATAAVAGFGSLNVATTLGYRTKAREVSTARSGSHGEVEQLVLPVAGMTCVTCEWTIEHALAGLEGVVEVKASASERKVLVRYEAARVSLEQMLAVIATTGYKASSPRS